MCALAHKPPAQSLQSTLHAIFHEPMSNFGFKAISSIYGLGFRFEIALKGLPQLNENGEIVRCH
jgi:hypothetical protein